MRDLAFSSIKELLALINSRTVSHQEVLRSSLQRFEKYDGSIGSALEVFDEESILATSKQEGPLAGIPGIVKDNICQKDRIAACASKILANYRAPYNATAVTKLQEAGAMSVGRANCDEFAMGSSGETSAYKKTHNPWDLSRVPGGSSSGSIAAVAAGFVPWALGSETGGSVRLPAAFCGIVGSKPTYGRVSRRGLIAYGSSLDQIGIATRTVYDNALVLSVIAGYDTGDSTTVKVPVPDYTALLTGKLKPGLRIGIVDNALNADGVDPEIISAIDAAIQHYESLGARVQRITLPMIEYGAAVYFIISRAEAASNLARFDGVRYGARDMHAENLLDMYCETRGKGFGAEVRRRIMLGNYVLSAGHADQYYQGANKVRALMRAEFMAAFKDVDMMLMPVSPTPAYGFDAFTSPLEMDLQDLFTIPPNLAGIPAISVPCGFTASKLPVAFQLIGPEFSEGELFAAAYAYEQSTPWHMMHPPMY